jgi:hypothetical protein
MAPKPQDKSKSIIEITTSVTAASPSNKFLLFHSSLQHFENHSCFFDQLWDYEDLPCYHGGQVAVWTVNLLLWLE